MGHFRDELTKLGLKIEYDLDKKHIRLILKEIK